MFEISNLGWVILAVSAFLIGLSKTGIPGLGILIVPLVAAVIPARASTGVILPMLIVADIFAVWYYKRHAVWPHLIRLIPWAMTGIVLGSLAMKKVNDQQLRPIIGVIVLVMLGLNYWRNRRKDEMTIPTQWWFAAIMGLLAGVTTMMANAAGPIMAIYLLAMQLPKNEFLGSGAWYFLLMNCFKVPFSANLGLINPQSLQINLLNMPIIVGGAVAGIYTARFISEKVFVDIIQILAFGAAIKLLW